VASSTGASEATDPAEGGSIVVVVGDTSSPFVSAVDIEAAIVGGAVIPGAELGGWYVTSTGDVGSYGDALDHGSMRGATLVEPVVAMASTTSGGGYWLAASDGGIFAFGDAGFYGSTGDIDLHRPMVDIASTPTGAGYWMAADDGGIFAFGDAGFYGSMGAFDLNHPIVGMSSTPTGLGYWLVAIDGGVFAFGDAVFYGSSGSNPPAEPVIDLVPTSSGQGYHLVTEGGDTIAFGDATDFESLSGESADVGAVVGASAHGDSIVLTAHPSRPSMAVWQSGGMTDSLVGEVQIAVAEAGGVSSLNHTGTVRVLALRRRGQIIDAAAPGWQIPFTARAIDPRAASVFVGGDVVGALERGEVVLSWSTAELRGARPGDVIEFYGWNGRAYQRVVGAVVPDGRVASTEILFSIADASTFGFSRPSSLWVVGVDDYAALETSLAKIAASRTWVRWARSWDEPSVDNVLSTLRLKTLLGEFEYRFAAGDNIEMEPAWVAQNIARQDFPIIGQIWCNRALFDDLTAALTEVEAAGLTGVIDVGDTRRYGGCWNPRRIRGTSGGAVSRHAWGLGVDINPSTNRWGTPPTLDLRVVEIFRANGFAWGGTWTRPDGMHFEWIGAAPRPDGR